MGLTDIPIAKRIPGHSRPRSHYHCIPPPDDCHDPASDQATGHGYPTQPPTPSHGPRGWGRAKDEHGLKRECRRGRVRAGAGGANVAGPPKDALEGKGSQRRAQKRSDRRLEAVAEAVGGGCRRLQMPLKLALGVRETAAVHRLGARGGTSPLSNASLGPPPDLWRPAPPRAGLLGVGRLVDKATPMMACASAAVSVTVDECWSRLCAGGVG